MPRGGRHHRLEAALALTSASTEWRLSGADLPLPRRSTNAEDCPFSVIAAARLNGLPSRYRNSLAALVPWYSGELGFEIGAHAQRATPATSPLDYQGDIAEVQESLGQANSALVGVCSKRLSNSAVLVRYAASRGRSDRA